MKLTNIYDSWIVRILLAVMLLSLGIFSEYVVQDIIPIQGLITLVILFAGMILIEHARGGSFHTAGFPLDSVTFQELIMAITLGMIPIVGLIIAMALFDLARTSYGSIFLLSGIVPIIIYAVIEELIFRGMMFQACIDRFSFVPTALLFSALFASAHIANPSFDTLSMINTFLAGLLFSFARYHMHSLWLPIALHVSWNGTLFMTGMTLSGLEISESFMKVTLSHDIPSPWFMSPYGIEGTAYCTLALIAMGIFISTIHVPPQRQARIFRMEYAINH